MIVRCMGMSNNPQCKTCTRIPETARQEDITRAWVDIGAEAIPCVDYRDGRDISEGSSE